METIKLNDTGAGVEDVQNRLCLIGLLDASGVDGTFGQQTAGAVEAFREKVKLPKGSSVDAKCWAALVDATFSLGDRTLYLRMPHFHGHDVKQLQQALSALGFACGAVDGIFGAFTELALRKFQANMQLPTDGIAGAYTFATIQNLHHSWEGKDAVAGANLGFARASSVLEQNALCLFGTSEFTRSVAARMSNLALATNPASKITSAENLLVAPSADMLMVHIVLPSENTSNVSSVQFQPEESLAQRLQEAIGSLQAASGMSRIAVVLPGCTWQDAGQGRSAQHFAITLLDALCTALA